VPPSPLLRTLQELAALAGVRGDADERLLLARATTLVERHGIATDADLGALVESGPPADEALLTRLRHMYEAGGWVILESAIADLPTDLRWLFESGVITIAQLAALHEATGATACADLEDLVRREALRHVPGFDPEREAAVAGVLPRLRRAVPRMTLGRASAVADSVLRLIRSHGSVEWAEPAGSLRRGQETVGDIELVVASSAPAAVFSAVIAGTDVSRSLHRSQNRLYILTDGAQVGIRCAELQIAGATLLQMTGSRGHNEALFSRAAKRGWSLGPNGLDRQDGSLAVGSTEADIYDALDLQWVPAEIRVGGDEMRAAETGTLPTLIVAQDIRGDLHMHTHYSDGRDGVEAMVQACIDLGYEYLAITDHSPSSAASRSLTRDSVRQQSDDIAAMRERYPQITILHGCEVDILPDERLDFSDRTLEQFDIVLASLHERAGQSPEQLMRRYLAAMRHPLVNVITHPSNRLVPSREGYELDYERLFAAAVETGTVVEIDGAPSHLDLDGTLARRAVLAGAMLSVNSDSHRAEALGRQMGFGVMTARRGWVERRHVLNTRPLGDIRAFIAGKRRA
jgi:DNA polymerase (family 10)